MRLTECIMCDTLPAHIVKEIDDERAKPVPISYRKIAAWLIKIHGYEGISWQQLRNHYKRHTGQPDHCRLCGQALPIKADE